MKIVSVEKDSGLLVEECSENTDEVKMVGITLFEHENVHIFFHNLCCLNYSNSFN